MLQQQGQRLKKSRQKQPFVLQFTSANRPNRIHSLNRLNYPEDKKKDGTFVAKKDIIEHELFDHHIVQSNMLLQSQLKKLHATFIYEKVPQFYAYYFMNQLINASEQKIQDNIFKQTEQLKGKRSYYHVITNSIKARQGCLKQLRRCLDNLFQNQQDNINKHVFREQITHYRKLTNFVISHIRSWKEYLKSISPEIDYISYYYKGQDYLQKIMNDCEFIFNSFLGRQLKFSYKNDPYLMRPYIDSKQQSKYYQLFSFDEDQKVHYLVDINFLADQKASYLDSKMHSKSDKIKQIEKIYNYKQNPLASRIFIKKIHLLDKRDKQKQQNNDLTKSKNNVIKIDNFIDQNLSSEKRIKFEQLNKKTQKMQKIKQLYKKKAYSQQKLINTQTLFAQSKTNPFQKKLGFTQFNPSKDKFQYQNYDSDFENMVKKKQLKIMENYKTHGNANFQNTQSQKLSRTIKIKDNLSESRGKFLTKDEGADQLQKVLMQLEKLSPQKLDSYRLGSSKRQTNVISSQTSRIQKSRLLFQPMKTSRIHNEQVFVNVRNQVIQQIQRQKAQKHILQQHKRDENQQIQEILQKKIDQQGTRVIKNSRAKDLQGREQLAKKMNSSQIFGYEQETKIKNSEKLSSLQEQLKKQMQLKWLRQVQSELKHKISIQQMQSAKRQDEQNLTKQFKKANEKVQREKRFDQIQKQQRALAQRKVLQLNDQRKKQIQEQMQTIIQNEKQKMEKFAVLQKMEIEEELKEVMKQNILNTLKKQKQKYYDDNKKQDELKLAELKYRDEVREKIEEQYKIGLQMKNNRDRQQRMTKVRMVKEKLQNFDNKTKNSKVTEIKKQKQSSPQKSISLAQVKSQLTNFPKFGESFLVKGQSPEKQKKKLREQFELELFSFRTPQAYSRIEAEKQGRDSLKSGQQQAENQIKLLKKDFTTRIGLKVQQYDEQQQRNVNEQASKIQNNKSQQKKLQQPKQLIIEDLDQNPRQNNKSNQRKMSEISHQSSGKFTRFSQQQKKMNAIVINEDQIMRLKLDMSPQEYLIYKKKKLAITAKRDFGEWNAKKKQEEEMKKDMNLKDQYQKMSVASKYSKQPVQQFNQNAAFNEDIDQSIMQITMTNRQNEEKIQRDSEEKVQQLNDQKSKVKEKKKKQKEREHLNVDIVTANSRVQTIYKKHFMTSSSQNDEDEEKIKKKKSPKKSSIKMTKNKEKRYDQPQQLKKIQTKNQPINQKDYQIDKPKKTVTKIRQIPLHQLRQFFDDHFEHLPKTLKKLNIYKKQELIKVLLEQNNSFSIVQYIKQSYSLGLAIFVHNQNKIKYRSLNILHLGIYDESEKDYLDVLINTTKLVMKKDPCQEVALSILYDKEIGDQNQFVKKLQKIFDPYGVILQKKIFNTQFQRKFVIRRTLGEQFTESKQSSNLGINQFQINFFITEKQVNDFDEYETLGYRIGCYGLAAHYISEKSEQQHLAQLIRTSTVSKDPADKNLGYLAKLSLAMKINTSFMRLGQIIEEQYPDIMALNLQLINKHKKVLSYPPQKVEEPNKIIWLNYKQDIQIPYDFYIQTLKIRLQKSRNAGQDQQYFCKYLRLTPPIQNKKTESQEIKPVKNSMFTIKSTAYSTWVHVLPCKNNMKYKVFLLDSEQYDTLKKPVPLDVYMRVLFANLEKHEKSSYEHVWIPEVQSKGKFQISQFPALIKDSAVLRTQWNYTYTDYLGNSLKIQPTHRDLVITPPFIFGVLNMQIQKVVQGSPIYIQRVDKDDLKYLKTIDKIIKQSD